MAGNKSGHCKAHSPVASGHIGGGGGGGGGDKGDLVRKEKRETAVNFPWK